VSTLAPWRRRFSTRSAIEGFNLGGGPVTITLAGLFLLAVLICAAWPGLLVSGDPLAIHPDSVLGAPSVHHIFGTDQFGRDVLAQIIYGARKSLLIGVAAVLISSVSGTLLGVVAGYYAGAVDAVLMRLIDVMLCFPGILLALVFQAALGAGVGNEIIAVAIASVPAYARLARGQALSIRSRPYLIAARSAGVREPIILGRHILPAVLAPTVALATIGLGTAVVLAAALSFLGLGSPNGNPDWGQLIGSGRDYLSTAWWIATFPGLVITLLVLSAGIAGDVLQRRLSAERR
jgi:peptide/nickel transport system permease protein